MVFEQTGGTLLVLTEDQQAALEGALESTPWAVGIELANWTWKAVRVYLREHFGVRLGKNSCLRYLHRLGFVQKRPKKRLTKADAAPRNPGMSITNAARTITAEVIEAYRLPTPPMWIEHHPPETTGGRTENFDLVLFDSYEIREARAPYMGDRAVEIGSPIWKALDRASVETLVGEELR